MIYNVLCYYLKYNLYIFSDDLNIIKHITLIDLNLFKL
jgi:hypothetical protein